jgi:NDP-sugar pyrophosphorylase family protein
MKYAILAAGNGSRLMQEGELTPKPLVKVGGEALIDRLLRVFMANDATEIAVICNSQMTAVVAYLETLQKAGVSGLSLPVRYIIIKELKNSDRSFVTRKNPSAWGED